MKIFKAGFRRRLSLAHYFHDRVSAGNLVFFFAFASRTRPSDVAIHIKPRADDWRIAHPSGNFPRYPEVVVVPEMSPFTFTARQLIVPVGGSEITWIARAISASSCPHISASCSPTSG